MKNKSIILFIFVNFLLVLLLLAVVTVGVIIDDVSKNEDEWQRRFEGKFTQELEGILSGKISDSD